MFRRALGSLFSIAFWVFNAIALLVVGRMFVLASNSDSVSSFGLIVIGLIVWVAVAALLYMAARITRPAS